MNTLNKLTAFAALALTTFMSSSCEDLANADAIFEHEVKLSDQYLAMEATFSSIYKTVDLALRDSTFRASDSAAAQGAIVTRNGNRILMDFNAGSPANDGHTRAGVIEIVETGDYRTAGGSVAVDLDGYKQDDQQISGQLTTNLYTSDSMQIMVSNFSISDSMTMTASRTIVWLQGFGTTSMSDDIYRFGGMAQASAGPNSINITTLRAMRFDNSCQYRLTHGELELGFQIDTVSDNASGLVDFIDNDGCENLAKITLEKDGRKFSLARQLIGF